MGSVRAIASGIVGSIALLLAVAAVAEAPVQAVSWQPDGSQRAKLEAGDVLIYAQKPDAGPGFKVRGIALVEAPPAQVWPVLRNCGEFDRFMPRTRETTQVRLDPTTTTCQVRMDLPFPFSDLHSKVRSVERRVGSGGYQRSWSLLEGDFERSDGSWTILPWGPESRHSLVIYDQEAAPKTVLPDGLLRMGQKQLLPGAFDAIRKRVSSQADVAAGGD